MGQTSGGYERSEDVGRLQADGSYDSVQSTGRTSENAWCSHRNNCRTDPIVEKVHERIAKVTGIPKEHSEDLQLLKYTPGQFYRQHHDYIEHQRDRRCGPRVLTFFLYLSDVEAGGATNFPDLDIAVAPKVGKALLWPSVLDSNPMNKEPRTDHEAQDVVKGLKFGANGKHRLQFLSVPLLADSEVHHSDSNASSLPTSAWIHLHDYMDAQEMGCT